MQRHHDETLSLSLLQQSDPLVFSVFPEEKGHGAHYVCQPCHDSCPSPKGSASPKVAKATPSEPGSVLQSVSDKQLHIAAESAKMGRINVTVPLYLLIKQLHPMHSEHQLIYKLYLMQPQILQRKL
jgi:hypothetical protein